MRFDVQLVFLVGDRARHESVKGERVRSQGTTHSEGAIFARGPANRRGAKAYRGGAGISPLHEITPSVCDHKLTLVELKPRWFPSGGQDNLRLSLTEVITIVQLEF